MLTLLLFAGALGFVLWKAGGPGPFVAALSTASPLVGAACLGLLAVDLGTDGLRYTATAAAMGTRVPPLLGVRVALINLFGAYTTPSAAGAAPIVAWALHRRGHDGSRGLAIGLIKGVLGFYVLVPTAALLVLYAPDSLMPTTLVRRTLAGTGLFATVVLVGFGIMALRPRAVARGVERATTALVGRTVAAGEREPGRVRGLVLRLGRLLEDAVLHVGTFLHGGWIRVLATLGITLLNISVLALLAVVLGLLMAPGVPVAHLAVAGAFLVVLAMLAPTPGGAGVAEGAGVLLFARLMPDAQAAALIVIWRTTTCYVPCLLGALLVGLELRAAPPAAQGSDGAAAYAAAPWDP